MSFVHYRVVLRLLSPLHIGKRKYGNLMETREYVPGRTLWGALTARITRDYFGGETDKYEQVGDFLKENFRFGYLWPSLDKKTPYFPWEHEDFDYLFKFGHLGQSIDYDKGSTEEGQLHEVEYIAPKTRYGQDVYLIGDLWIRKKIIKNERSDNNEVITLIEVNNKEEEISLKRIFNSLQLGAERNYGWGRVKGELSPTDSAIGGVKFSTDEEVILSLEEGSRLIYHALAFDWIYKREGNQEKKFKAIPSSSVEGAVEPLTGYAYLEKKGWHILPPFICFVPGGKILRKGKFLLSPLGILSYKG